MGPADRDLLLEAFDSNWIAPLGPHVDAFEQDVVKATGVRHAVALTSGTAALHLAMLVLGVGAGDEVLVPTMTFVAAANAVRYVGAEPVFVDSEWTSWNIDPELVTAFLAARALEARLPAAVIAVDVYGQCADYKRIAESCAHYGVPLVEDAAEALGATYLGRPAGSFGALGVLSFNGNKIITTSGGGMLVTNREDLASHARYLATQAREPVLHYEHREVGFNYRMSNLLAAVGRGQLRGLSAKVDRLREIHSRYSAALGGIEGLSFMPEASYGRCTRWLTVMLVEAAKFGAGPQEVITRLEAADIEARPAWKPMHQQPAFGGRQVVGGSVADAIFEQGVCLPSGSGMADADVDRVIDVLLGRAR